MGKHLDRSLVVECHSLRECPRSSTVVALRCGGVVGGVLIGDGAAAAVLGHCDGVLRAHHTFNGTIVVARCGKVTVNTKRRSCNTLNFNIFVKLKALFFLELQ